MHQRSWGYALPGVVDGRASGALEPATEFVNYWIRISSLYCLLAKRSDTASSMALSHTFKI